MNYDLVAIALSTYRDRTDDRWFEMLDHFCKILQADPSFDPEEFKKKIDEYADRSES